MAAVGFTLDVAGRAALIAAILGKVREEYVFPVKAEEIAATISRRMTDGAYDATPSGDALAALLTEHLQEISGDKHLRVSFDAEPQLPGDQGQPSLAQQERWQQLDVQRNHGFARVERLAGNVGYLELRQFARPEVAGDLAAASMTLLANTAALLIDLRQNGGGSPAMVALLATYLFRDPVHLNSLYWRKGDRTQQWWTLPYVPGRRYLDKPVYVLTSGRTFSAAEEFAYDLQSLGRATIVGEATAGGAHPERRYQLTPHFSINVPRGRAINPVTGTNWEGIGVAPDIAVLQNTALQVAHAEALRAVLASLGGQPTGASGQLTEEIRSALETLVDTADRPA